MADDELLGERGRDLIGSPENLIFVSAATIWELRIKEGIGKLDRPSDFAEALAGQAFEPLTVTAAHAHAHALRGLPRHHRDPFDRMLVAQARVEKLTILTREPVMGRYDVAALLA